MYKQAVLKELVKQAFERTPSNKEEDYFLPVDRTNKYENTPRNYGITGAAVGSTLGAAIGAGSGYLYNRHKQKGYNKKVQNINNSNLNAVQKAKAIAALKKPSLAKHMLIGGGIGATLGGVGGGTLGYIGGKDVRYQEQDRLSRLKPDTYDPKYYTQNRPVVQTRGVRMGDYSFTDEGMPDSNAHFHLPGIRKSDDAENVVVTRNGDRYSIEVGVPSDRLDGASRQIRSTIQFGGSINDLTPEKINQIMGAIRPENRNKFVEPNTYFPDYLDDNIDNIFDKQVDMSKYPKDHTDVATQYIDNWLATGNGYTYEPKGTAWAGTDGKADNVDNMYASIYDLLTNKDLTNGIAGTIEYNGGLANKGGFGDHFSGYNDDTWKSTIWAGRGRQKKK